MTPISFEVIGLPSPQGDKSAVLINGQARLIENKRGSGRARMQAWRSAVAEVARDVAEHDDVPAPLSGPLAIDVLFRMPRPASRPRNHHRWHVVSPDKDKLLRSTFDALKHGGLIADDSLFCAIRIKAIEVVGWVGAEITIWTPGEAPR